MWPAAFRREPWHRLSNADLTAPMLGLAGARRTRISRFRRLLQPADTLLRVMTAVRWACSVPRPQGGWPAGRIRLQWRGMPNAASHPPLPTQPSAARLQRAAGKHVDPIAQAMTFSPGGWVMPDWRTLTIRVYETFLRNFDRLQDTHSCVVNL